MHHGLDTAPGISMTPDMLRLRRKACADRRLRFNSLMGLIQRREGLRASFERLAANKAPGVDGVRKADYAAKADDHLHELSSKIARLSYRPKPARRVYIPKLSGGRRPLGIPSFEDRIVQDRLSLVLQAIWEPEFRGCSFGFRPGRSAHDALRRVAKVITHENTQWVVEADIKGFFNQVNHQHLLRFIEHRIADRRFVRILQRFLKSGIMEDGAFSTSDIGTPQGGLVSPVLANIYLHYVLDWWFEGRFVKFCRGKAHLIRYADDFVVCFERRDDAKRFMNALPQRLGDFGLELEPSKTALLRFGRFAKQDSHRDGRRRPATFSFLGFTHYCGRSRTGKFVVGRKTEAKRVRKKLQELNHRLRAMRVAGGATMTTYMQMHLRGHMQYYGVSGNMRALQTYYRLASRILLKWLNLRSQKRSLNWARYNVLLGRGLLPRPRIIHHLYPVPTSMT